MTAPLPGGDPSRAAVTRRRLGRTPDGRTVDAYLLRNGRVEAEIATYGASLRSVRAPDRRDRRVNVVLGFRTLAEQVENATASAGTTYFGATIGRYANRIGGARFDLDGSTHRLPANDATSTLHGGPGGLHQVVWDAEPVRAGGVVGVTLTTTSPAGDQGFPGALRVRVTYSLTVRGALRLRYVATTDAPTVVNLTNHAYFNLAGEGSGGVEDHRLRIAADRYTPVDGDLVPTGRLASVVGTPFDFRRPTPIGRIRGTDEQLRRAGGYDHNWVLDRDGAGEGVLADAADVCDPGSGRTLRVRTTEPGLQFYGGTGLDGSIVGPGGRAYRAGDAFSLETQHFPDSPNRPAFPSTVLRPGERFTSATDYVLGVDARSTRCATACPEPARGGPG